MYLKWFLLLHHVYFIFSIYQHKKQLAHTERWKDEKRNVMGRENI